jgi:hypothetical protein
VDPKIVEDEEQIIFFNNLEACTGVMDYKFSNKILDFITQSNQLSRQVTPPRDLKLLPSHQVKEEPPVPEKKNFIQ